MFSPSQTGSGEPVRRSSRSALVMTLAVATAVLFVGLPSGSAPLTVSVFVKEPSVEGRVTSATVTACVAATEPNWQENAPAALVQEPCDGVAEMNCSPGGSVAASVAAAAPGPRFETVSVSGQFWPSSTVLAAGRAE